ncbi:unnamed protein product [Spirodela intermedia]|uniref:Uncharacterized protein n=1 Tax=Spirodela intermedia TaxID=51605 RepID=A0A7I8IAK4_SPIIN|nr:unnamed protein product [Spirodela intermedia]CAA6654705.1 unnamed protein product [Spirodela intermedia]
MDDPASDGESDASSEAPANDSDYRLISSGIDPDDDDGSGDLVAVHSNGGGPVHLSPPPSPSFLHHRGEIAAISRLHLNGGGLEVGGAREEDEDEEEREREREASITRAFSEDERRRTAPLSQENAAMIRDAMRGVPEDHWVDQLRRLRTGDPAPASHS